MAITKLQAESLNLADDFTFTGTVAGAGESNVPAFFVYKNTSQTISDATNTKITWNTKVIDTHTAYDTSTSRFTVPSGQAGKYLFTSFIHIFHPNENLAGTTRSFRKNGNQVSSVNMSNTAGNMAERNSNCSVLLDLSVGDYIETYAYANTVDNTSITIYGESQYYCYFYGYKLTT